MNNNEISDPTALAAALTAMQQQMDRLQRQNDELKQQQDARKPTELHQDIAALFAPHLQLRPMEQAERKRILSQYGKCEQLPVPLRDDNGLAGKALGGEGGHKKWALTYLQSAQKEALDILRIAALGLNAAIQLEQGPQRIQHLEHVIRDIISMAGDNAQRMARTQLEHVFEVAGVKGARSLLNPDLAEDCSIDESDTNILQQAHIDAMQDIRKFHTSISQVRGNKNNGKQGGRGFKQGGRNYRGRGGGRGRGYGGGGRGGGFRSNWRGYGRGSGGGGYGGDDSGGKKE